MPTMEMPGKDRNMRPGWRKVSSSIVAGVVPVLAACGLPFGVECEELFVNEIEAPATARRGEVVAVNLVWGAGAPLGEPSVSVHVDDADRIVTFAAVRCQVNPFDAMRAYPQSVIEDASLKTSFVPRSTGTYTLRLRGTPPTATVQVGD